ncbi:GDSL-type esterase/lipase family protein [Ensifer canadensis]|uniref:GDSL-type esterase/lipase family protein n=1 Tax=Ensifer canadensis TaxID=555315 RepID=UPI0035E3E0DD
MEIFVANEIQNAFNTAFADGPSETPLAVSKPAVRTVVGGTVQAQFDDLAERISNVATVTASGASWKTAVTLATTGNITLSGEQTIDGVLTSSTPILVKNQSTGAQNGIYTTAAGAWVRRSDADAAAEIVAAAVFVRSGTANGGKQFVCSTPAPITLGTTVLTFIEMADQSALNANLSSLEGEVDTALLPRTNLTTEDLDTMTATGLYRQPLDANATLARHYPDTRAGTLEVVGIGDYIVQTYTTWFGKRFWRTKLGAFAWQGWYENARAADIANVLAARNNLTTEDLNAVTTTGLYRQAGDVNAILERNYPDTRSGMLEVVTIGNFTTQLYTTWFGRRFWRTRYSTFDWLSWSETARMTDINQPYFGKTIAWIGDSIVEGNSYPTTIGQNLGATVHKFGFGSCTMSKNPGSPDGYDKMTMYRMATAIASGDFSEIINGAEWVRDNTTPSDDNTAQANAMAALDWSTVDYLVIAFGTNDYASPTPLGSSLTPDAAGETFMGALVYAIETIQQAYPRIQILLTGMSWRTRYFSVTPELNSDTVPDAQGKYLIDYQDALLSAGEKYRIPAYDHYRKSGINAFTYTHYLDDGVHPNTNGVALWVKKFSAFLLSS